MRELVEVQRDGYVEIQVAGYPEATLTDAEWEKYSAAVMAKSREKLREAGISRLKQNHDSFRRDHPLK